MRVEQHRRGHGFYSQHIYDRWLGIGYAPQGAANSAANVITVWKSCAEHK